MRTYRVEIEGEEFLVGVRQDGSYTINGEPVHADIRRTGESRYSTLIDGRSSSLLVSGTAGTYRVVAGSLGFDVNVEGERKRLMRSLGGPAAAVSARTEVRAPMPALVVRIEVKEGDTVDSGRGLIVLEAMKMENELKSPRKGTVTSIAVEHGKAVEKGQLLLVID